MSQDIRDYELVQVDNRRSNHPREARRMSLTATVGPTKDGFDESRGVQITLDAEYGTVYARVSEPQIRDLIDVLESRLEEGEPPEATGVEAERLTVMPDGESHD